MALPEEAGTSPTSSSAQALTPWEDNVVSALVMLPQSQCWEVGGPSPKTLLGQ